MSFVCHRVSTQQSNCHHCHLHAAHVYLTFLLNNVMSTLSHKFSVIFLSICHCALFLAYYEIFAVVCYSVLNSICASNKSFSSVTFLFPTSQRKSLDKASPKLGAAIRIAMVQMMLKTLNPTRHSRSMTAAANCHCSAKLSCRSCSRTRSTKNCTSTKRACSWLSTATARTTPLVCMATDRPAPGLASKPQGPEVAMDGSGSGDTGGSCRLFPNLDDGSWWWIGVSPAAPATPDAPSLSSPPM